MRIILVFILSAIVNLYPQNGDKISSIFCGIDYITSARIFLNPKANNIIERNNAFEIENLFSPVVDLRIKINESIQVGLSSEYVKKSQKAYNLTVLAGSQSIKLLVDDGVEFIPVELSVYYLMPFSTNDFKFTMGAGLGYYYGRHIRELGSTSNQTVDNDLAFGLLVSVGMEYKLTDWFGLRFDMKFRDPESKLTNRYLNNKIDYEGTQITLSDDRFYSNVNLNGICFLLGGVFHF